jgi:hypothetical protein
MLDLPQGTRLTGWTKLNHKCHACNEPHADLEITFRLPDNGMVKRAWHWDCLPIMLRTWQRQDEQRMLGAACTPPSLPPEALV